MLVALNELLIHVTFWCLGLAMMLVIDRDGVGIVVLTVCCCLCFSWLPAIPPSGVWCLVRIAAMVVDACIVSDDRVCDQ